MGVKKGNRIMYNDDPVLEVGNWRILCPNAYGKRYKGLINPILIHKCAEHKEGEQGVDWQTQINPNLMNPKQVDGDPECSYCKDPVPDEIQGLLAMYYMDNKP